MRESEQRNKKKNVKLYGALNTASVAVFVYIGVLFGLFKIVCMSVLFSYFKCRCSL